MASKQKVNAKPALEIGKGQRLRVKGPRDGYRRAGMAHTRAGVDHEAGAFNADQLRALQDDSNITLQVVDAAKADKAE